MKKFLLTILSLSLISFVAIAAPKKAKNKAANPKQASVVKLDPSKPNVLLIGDSISIGYEPFVTAKLKDVANIVRIKGNGRATENALEKEKGDLRINNYIGKTNWDVIHFNFGLHDLCYRHPESKISGNRDKAKGTISVTIEDYEANLQKIVDILKSTNATLIFATTTHVPEGEAGRFPEDLAKYNAVAIKVMEKNGIIINPLGELSVGVHKDHGMGDVKYIDKDGDEYDEKEGNVHYDKAGSAILAEQVCKYIKDALDKRNETPSE